MTTTSKFSRVLRSAVATALVFGAQIASAQFLSPNVGTGSVVQITGQSLPNQGNGGAFNGTVVSVVSGAGAGSSFASFCLEKFEYIGYNSNLYVGGVTTATTNASGSSSYGASISDALSFQTAWLFTQYSNGTYGKSSTVNVAMQEAFWSLENEPGSTLNDLAQTYVTAANNAVTNGYTGYGNVRVLNLYTNAAYASNSHAQDQLVMLAPVPEPETYAMLLAGLGLMGAMVRRRKQQQAA